MIKFKPIALMLALGAFYCQGAFDGCAGADFAVNRH